ncbi:MAG: elongation factor G, partial [Cyanobacteria bacterium J06649_11]
MIEKVRTGSHSIAIVGPYSSGKTTLLESLLFVTEAISRKGCVKHGNTISDSSTLARERQMSLEVSAASTDFKDVSFTFIDCPGYIELAQETYNALIGVDAAIVVCEPVAEKVLTLAPLFKFLDDWEIPHLVFVNKMDKANIHVLNILNALKAVSSRPLVAHQYPILQRENLIGFIDLVSEKAYHYHPGAAADAIPFPETLREEEHAAREEMLEILADFDDHLLEELLENIEPNQEEIIKDLKLDLRSDLVVPVFFGIAEQDYGVRPLLEALLKEAPLPQNTAKRRLSSLNLNKNSDTPVAQVLKTYYTPQGGKLSLVRIWQGILSEGMTLNGIRVGSIYRLMGQNQQHINQASFGEIVALTRLEGIKTGDTLSVDSQIELPRVQQLEPVYALAIVTEKRNDEVKLSSALSKLLEEDPSLVWEQHGDTHEVILWGQGEIHLQVSLDRL